MQMGLGAISERPISALASSDSVTGRVASIYLSTNGFVSHSSASVPSTLFLPRVRQALDFSRTMFTGGQFGGPVAAQGEIVIENTDGYFDSILTGYAIDGRRVVVRLGGASTLYDDFRSIFDGTARQWAYTEDEIRLPIRDNLENLAVPIQTTLYTSADGGANLAGKPKPILFGKVFNIAPPCRDTSNLIYDTGVNTSVTVSAVYDAGIQLSAVVSSPAAGQYVATASGFQLGGTPAGLITATIRSPISTTASAVQDIVVTQLNLPSSTLDLATFYDFPNTAQIGLWVGTDQRTALDVIAELINGVSGWFGYSRTGKLQIGVLSAPATTGLELTSTDILAVERVELPPEISPPNYQRRVGYQKNYTVQTTDLAGAVTDARRQFLREQFRVATSTDSTILQIHLLATNPDPIAGLFVSQSDAQDEADRLLALYKEDRSLYRITVKKYVFGFNLGDTVRITYPRWDMTSGKFFVIVGIAENAMDGTLELELFG